LIALGYVFLNFLFIEEGGSDWYSLLNNFFNISFTVFHLYVDE
jgi:hypothetical protein